MAGSEEVPLQVATSVHHQGLRIAEDGQLVPHALRPHLYARVSRILKKQQNHRIQREKTNKNQTDTMATQLGLRLPLVKVSEESSTYPHKRHHHHKPIHVKKSPPATTP